MRVLVAGMAALLTAGCVSSGGAGVQRTPDRAADEVAGPSDAASPAARVLGSGDRAARLAYGPDDGSRFVDLRWPAGPGPHPVVVLVHGGFWRAAFGLDLMEPLADDLDRRGWATLNLEYRRVGDGGGHPATFADVAAGTDLLASPAVAELVADAGTSLDLDRVVTVGHSAGGHLATWLAGRSVLPAGVVGAGPLVVPCAAVSQAGVLDLATAAAVGLGGTAVADLLGVDPSVAPELVAVTSPQAMLPLDVPVLAVHGARDDLVPLWQSSDYVRAATAAGAVAEQVVLEGDHFDVIDPGHELWQAVVDRLPALCG